MKKLFKNLIIVFLSFFLASCATPIKHFTASGKPEVTIESTDLGAVKSTLVSSMLNRGYGITKDSDFRIAFDRPIENPLAAALLGSRYDSTPNARITYSIVRIGKTIRVIADIAIITNPGSAFERYTNMNSSQESQKIQIFLDAIKISVEQ